MMLNKPATAHEKIRVHLTVFLPGDGITCFDGNNHFPKKQNNFPQKSS